MKSRIPSKCKGCFYLSYSFFPYSKQPRTICGLYSTFYHKIDLAYNHDTEVIVDCRLNKGEGTQTILRCV